MEVARGQGQADRAGYVEAADGGVFGGGPGTGAEVRLRDRPCKEDGCPIAAGGGPDAVVGWCAGSEFGSGGDCRGRQWGLLGDAAEAEDWQRLEALPLAGERLCARGADRARAGGMAAAAICDVGR